MIKLVLFFPVHEPCPVTGDAGHKNNIDERGYEKAHGMSPNDPKLSAWLDVAGIAVKA